jgi:hypothetical protein
MCGLGKNWMPPFFRHPAIPPHPASAEGEDSREYVEIAATQMYAKPSRRVVRLRGLDYNGGS